MIGNDEISAAIVKLAEQRGAGKTICPSEVARSLVGPDPDLWRPLMKPVRLEALKLAAQQTVIISKGGVPVDVENLSGIYRIAINQRN